jgi:Cys-rich protein (TIGR01571 family)
MVVNPLLLMLCSYMSFLLMVVEPIAAKAELCVTHGGEEASAFLQSKVSVESLEAGRVVADDFAREANSGLTKELRIAADSQEAEEGIAAIDPSNILGALGGAGPDQSKISTTVPPPPAFPPFHTTAAPNGSSVPGRSLPGDDNSGTLPPVGQTQTPLITTRPPVVEPITTAAPQVTATMPPPTVQAPAGNESAAGPAGNVSALPQPTESPVPAPNPAPEPKPTVVANSTETAPPVNVAQPPVDSTSSSEKDGHDECGFVWPWSHGSEEKTLDAHVYSWFSKWDSTKSTRCNIQASWNLYIVNCVITWLIWLGLAMLVVKFGTPEYVEMFRDPEDPLATFEQAHFNCMRRSQICICSFFCPAVQWAQTMHLAGFVKVRIALGLFFACALLNSLIFGGAVCYGICTSLLIIVYRQRLREKLGLKSWNRVDCVFDFVYVCCCPCCAISQEAQVVRYAYQLSNSPAMAASPPKGFSPPPTSGYVPPRQAVYAGAQQAGM